MTKYQKFKIYNLIKSKALNHNKNTNNYNYLNNKL